MARMRAGATLSFAIFIASCQSVGPRPPEACAPGAVADLAFTDVSDEWGLRDLQVDGNRLSTADFDGDGWPDLVVTRGVANGVRDEYGNSEVLRRRFLLRNTGSGFEDVTESSGFAAVRTSPSGESDPSLGRAFSYAQWADVDNDGDLDAVTITDQWEVDADNPDQGDRTEVMLNDGDGTFSLVDLTSEDSQLHEAWLHTTSSTWLDADRDGRIDLFTGNQYGVFGAHSTAEQDHLYMGRDAGHFSEKTRDRGLEMGQGGPRSASSASDYTDDEGGNVNWATFGVTSCDIDRDGDTDLITQTYGRGLNQLWLNDGEGQYTNVTAGADWSRDDGDDYSTDERFRCYCANEGAGAPDCAGVPGPVIGCSAGGWLPGWDDEPHRLGGNTFAAVCADLDEDGDYDLATGEIRHWWTPGASDASTIAWNEGGSPPTFERRSRDSIGLEQDHDTNDWNEGDLTVGAFDFDNDGWLDLLRPQSDYPDTRMYLYRNGRDGTFRDKAVEAGIDFPRAAGMAVADFDRDGDLDVVTTHSRMRCDGQCAYETPEVHLFRNDSGNQANGLTLRFRGAGRGATNASGIGVTVEVTTGEHTQVRELTGGHGHAGTQNGLALHVGLGEACVADSVKVIWNDAARTEQVFEELPANWETVFVEGQEQPEWPAWDGGE